jgi:hypothetical protein
MMGAVEVLCNLGDRGYMTVIARHFRRSWSLLLLSAWLLGGCAYLPKGFPAMEVGVKERGIASWYGAGFIGQPTASGELYDGKSLTGAHRSLPLGTVIKVTNAQNGRQVRVRINDRGPYVSGRILDLSVAAAAKLDFVGQGTTPVLLEVVGGAKDEFPSDRTPWRWIESILSMGRGPERVPGGEGGSVSETIMVWVSHDCIGGKYHRRVAPADVILGRRLRREMDLRPAEPEGEEIPAMELS